MKKINWIVRIKQGFLGSADPGNLTVDTGNCGSVWSYHRPWRPWR